MSFVSTSDFPKFLNSELRPPIGITYIHGQVSTGGAVPLEKHLRLEQKNKLDSRFSPSSKTFLLYKEVCSFATRSLRIELLASQHAAAESAALLKSQRAEQASLYCGWLGGSIGRG